MKYQSKFQQDIFLEVDKLILKFIWNAKAPKLDKTALKKKNKRLNLISIPIIILQQLRLRCELHGSL